MSRPGFSALMDVWRVAMRCVVCVVVAALCAGRASGECPEWIPTFGGQPGVDGSVRAIVEFNDGSGPAVYVGGGFSTAGGVAANSIAKWDGESWSALGSGVEERRGPGRVNALAVFDDGEGPALYAGGDFTIAGGEEVVGIARWQDGAWSALASEFKAEYGDPGVVYAFTVFDDGAGPALYVGGHFEIVNGIEMRSIARWNGREWTSLESDFHPVGVSALEVFDDGGGPALFAAGTFLLTDGTYTRDVMKWEGNSWSPLGIGLSNGVFPNISALTVFEQGDEPVLCVGGDFTTAGGVEVNSVAKWDGVSWSGFGSGFGTFFGTGSVFTLESFDDGTGPTLYAGGYRITGNIAKWDGVEWASVGDGVRSSGTGYVNALAVSDIAGRPSLFAGGVFQFAGGRSALSVASWDGGAWSSLGSGLSGVVHAIADFNDGGGDALYVTGQFGLTGDVVTNSIAKWEHGAWASLGTGLNGAGGQALCVFDDGSDPALFVGGWFSSAGGVPANRIAKWDGAAWSALGSGLNGPVSTLAVFDDGTGSALYAGGRFDTAGGVAARNIAKWDGSSWAALGTGINGDVSALLVFDDGTGPALYAGGRFGSAGGVQANSIARWNGSAWSALGDGLGGRGAQVFALAGFDDGSGAALYAGGLIATDTTFPFRRASVARWDGHSWGAVATDSRGIQFVRSLAVFHDGFGSALYAGGFFTSINGVLANNIAKWDGDSWSALDDGLGNTGSTDHVIALTVFDDGMGESLIAGGRFSASPGGDSNIARWGCERSCEADYNGDGVVNGADVAAFARDLHRDPGRTDLNGDGRSDGRDVRVFVSIWAVGCAG